MNTLMALLPPALQWQHQDTVAFVSFMAAGILFAAFHFAMLPRAWEQRFLRAGLDQADAILAAGVLRKWVGGVVLGFGAIVTLVLLGKSPLDYGVATIHPQRTLMLTVICAMILVPIVAISMRNPKMWDHYPEIRTPRFTSKAAYFSASGWIIYLIGFEYFFRGFLLFLWADLFGVWPALAMTTCVYILVHLPTNATETSSTVPMGIVFGLLALYTGGFLAPLIVHVLVAITSDVIAARLDPRVQTA